LIAVRVVIPRGAVPSDPEQWAERAMPFIDGRCPGSGAATVPICRLMPAGLAAVLATATLRSAIV